MSPFGKGEIFGEAAMHIKCITDEGYEFTLVLSESDPTEKYDVDAEPGKLVAGPLATSRLIRAVLQQMVDSASTIRRREIVPILAVCTAILTNSV